MKKDFFKDSKIKFSAYQPWISNNDLFLIKSIALTGDGSILFNTDAYIDE